MEEHTGRKGGDDLQLQLYYKSILGARPPGPHPYTDELLVS